MELKDGKEKQIYQKALQKEQEKLNDYDEKKREKEIIEKAKIDAKLNNMGFIEKVVYYFENIVGRFKEKR